MAGETYTEDCIVLKKTKLGESDLILTFLDSKGERRQGIAKGARKPQSSFSSYLELGNHVHILFAKGKKLDVITETRLEESHPVIMRDAARFSCASCILEMAQTISEENLVQPRLFEMTLVALRACETIDASRLPLLAASYMLKASSISGIRPVLTSCASCGSAENLGSSRYTGFSIVDGGALCDHCANELEHTSVRNDVLVLAERLISSRFMDIESIESDSQVREQLLNLAHGWVSVHTASRIKSVEMLEAYC